MDTTEKNFETAIEAALLGDPLSGGEWEAGTLQEYRTALISAAVTGQIDVRPVAG